MAVNHKSGRLVVEVDPELKLALHAALAADGMSLKHWLVTRARNYLDERAQPRLFAAEPESPSYRSGERDHE